MEQFGLLRPAFLALVLGVPAVVALAARAAAKRRRALVAFAGAGSGLAARSPRRQALKAALLAFAVLAAAVALAGPYVDQRERPVKHLGIDLVIAVDTSQSMAVRDVEPDRLRVARDAVDTLARKLDGSRIALVLFAAEGAVRYPATTDPEVIAAALDNSARGFRLPAGSSLKAGLTAALGAFPEQKADATERALVVISDGEYPREDVPDVTAFRDRHIRIFTVAIGTSAGGQVPTYDSEGKFTGYLRGADGQPAVSRMQEGPLRAIAQQGDGRFWQHTGIDPSVDELVRELHAMDTATIEGEGGTVPDDRYQVPLALALAAVLAEWLLDDRVAMRAPRGARGRPSPRRRRRLSLLLGSLLVLGACSDSVYEQVFAANTLYARGDARGALARYRELQRDHPELPQLFVNAGNALHRLGEHQRAVSEYEAARQGADDRTKLNAEYGRGSSLFRLGKLDEARDAFIDALRADPSDRDAKFNIELIDRMRTDIRAQQQPGGGQGQLPQDTRGTNPSGPGQGNQPGQQGQPNSGNQSSPNSGDPNTTSPGPSLDRALLDFRKNLSEDDALRALDALRNEQRGLEGLLEGGGQRPGPNDRVPY